MLKISFSWLQLSHFRCTELRHFVPCLQNKFFGKDATRDPLLGDYLKLPVKFHQVLKKGIPKPYGFGFGMFGDYGELKNNAL